MPQIVNILAQQNILLVFILLFTMLRPAIIRLFFYCSLLLPLTLPAQEHQEVGIMAGVANYYGDLQQSWAPNYGYKPMGGILYKYFMNPNIGIRTGLSYTNLTAADSLSKNPAQIARNLSFATHLIEFHAALEINFLPIEIKKAHFSPYIFGGMAVFYYNPYALDPQGQKIYLRPLSTEGEGLPQYPDRKEYSLVNMSFPFGGGLKFFISKTILLAFELGYRYTNTGYLDDVSKSYVDLNVLNAAKGYVAAEMSYRGNTLPGWNGEYPVDGQSRGNPSANDWYWYGNLTLTIFFRQLHGSNDPQKTDCPRLFR